MAEEAVADRPAEPTAPKAKDARSPEPPPRGGARGDDNAKDAPDAPGSSDASDSADAEAAEREKERERAADRFKDRTRDPLAEEQGEEEPTDAAAATRARRSGQKLLASGRDLIGFDRSDVGRLHIGDINIGLDARRSGLSMRDGPVPEEELLRIRRTHIEPEGYVRLRRALEARRLLVLGGAPGTGRASTALALLEEVTRDGEGEGGRNSERVRRADPEGGVRGLATQVMGGEGGHPRGTGYVLEPALDRPGTLPPDGMDLDQLASALAEQGSYAVVVVSVGSAANPLLAGRYGAICPPAPTRELVAVRLRQRLEEEHGDPARDGAGAAPGTAAGTRTAGRAADRTTTGRSPGCWSARRSFARTPRSPRRWGSTTCGPPRPSCSPRCWPGISWAPSAARSCCPAAEVSRPSRRTSGSPGWTGPWPPRRPATGGRPCAPEPPPCSTRWRSGSRSRSSAARRTARCPPPPTC